MLRFGEVGKVVFWSLYLDVYVCVEGWKRKTSVYGGDGSVSEWTRVCLFVLLDVSSVFRICHLDYMKIWMNQGSIVAELVVHDRYTSHLHIPPYTTRVYLLYPCFPPLNLTKSQLRCVPV